MRLNDNRVTFPGTDIDLELPYEAASLQYHPPEYRRCTNGVMLVGYIGIDPHSGDCNPMEDFDGEGHIYSFSRRHTNFKPLDEVFAEHRKLPKHLIVPLSYFEHGNCLWDVQNGPSISGCPDMQWDGVRFAGVWVPCDVARENLKATVKQALKGQKWASKDLMRAVRKDAEIKAAIEYATGVCKTYTAWCNGDVYERIVVWYDAEGKEIDNECCGGYYTSEDAQNDAKSGLDYEFKRQQKIADETAIAECVP